MVEGTKMQYAFHGFYGDGIPVGKKQGGRSITPIEFKFDSFKEIDNQLKIIGVEIGNGAIHVFDAEKCRVVTEIDKEASRDAILG